MLNLIFGGMIIAPVLWGLWCWFFEPPLTEEELERALFRSKSWPSKPGEDYFSKMAKRQNN